MPIKTVVTHPGGCSCIFCSLGKKVGDRDNNTHDEALVESINQESIDKGYLPELAFYKRLPEDQQPTFKNRYRETRRPLFDGPLELKGHYYPQGNTVALTKYGIDDTDTALFFVDIPRTIDVLGRDPRIGDLVLAFDRPNMLHEIRKVEPHAKKVGKYRQFMIQATYYQHTIHDIDLISRRDLEPFAPDGEKDVD